MNPVTQTLAQFVATVTAQYADEYDISIEDASRLVEMFTNDAHEEYRKLGAPLGDTDAGFLTWLRPRYTPPITLTSSPSRLSFNRRKMYASPHVCASDICLRGDGVCRDCPGSCHAYGLLPMYLPAAHSRGGRLDPDEHADRDSDRDCDGDEHVNYDQYTHNDRYGHEHADNHEYADGHQYADEHGNSDGHQYADQYADEHGNSDGHQYADQYADEYVNSDADGHQYADGNVNANQYANANVTMNRKQDA